MKSALDGLLSAEPRPRTFLFARIHIQRGFVCLPVSMRIHPPKLIDQRVLSALERPFSEALTSGRTSSIIGDFIDS